MKAEEKQCRDQLAEFSRLAYRRGFTCGTGGNASVLIPGTDSFLISAGGCFLKDVAPDGVLKVAGDETVLDSPEGSRPSQETGFHAAIYARRPDVGGICHFHPPYAIVLASVDPKPPLMGYFRHLFRDLIVIPAAPAGSDKLRDLVIEAIETHPETSFFLMERHGIIALGETLPAAFDLADRAEFAFQMEFIQRNWC